MLRFETWMPFFSAQEMRLWKDEEDVGRRLVQGREGNTPDTITIADGEGTRLAVDTSSVVKKSKFSRARGSVHLAEAFSEVVLTFDDNQGGRVQPVMALRNGMERNGVSRKSLARKLFSEDANCVLEEVAQSRTSPVAGAR